MCPDTFGSQSPAKVGFIPKSWKPDSAEIISFEPSRVRAPVQSFFRSTELFPASVSHPAAFLIAVRHPLTATRCSFPAMKPRSRCRERFSHGNFFTGPYFIVT